ncbi:MAG: DUF6134 family protein [Ferruginibacter sp.]
MVTLFIILYIKKHKSSFIKTLRLLAYNKSFLVKLVLLLTATLLVGKIALSQTKNYQYAVKKAGSSIGEIMLTNTILGEANTVALVSNIKFRFLFLFTATAKEEVVFINGVMTSSSLYREQNGDKKTCLKTRKTATGYALAINESKEVDLNISSINYQTLSLYVNEPILTQQVYIDKYKKLLAIQKISSHQYKVVFPDDNFNEYFYQDGVCRMVKVHQSLFNVQIELQKIF